MHFLSLSLSFSVSLSGQHHDNTPITPFFFSTTPRHLIETIVVVLSKNEWLVNNEFSVADVAVGAYLNYVPVFFGRSVKKMPNRPFIGTHA
jgi:hypothetical protein